MNLESLGPIIVALLTGGALKALFDYILNRQGAEVSAAQSSVNTALQLKDEAMEDRAAAARDRAAALKERAEAIEARDLAQETLSITLEKLQYLEAQGVTELRRELNAAKERITALESMVYKLQDELKASKMREGKLRERLNRIRGELGTGPLGGDDGPAED